MALKDFEGLRKKYDEAVVAWNKIKAALDVYSEKAEKSKLDILQKAKIKNIDEVPALLDKLSKELEVRENTLRDKIVELESLVSEAQSSLCLIKENKDSFLDL